MNDLEIIVPVKNEENNLAELTQRIDASLKPVGIKYSIIFVDDNSTDNTRRVIGQLKKKYPVVLHKKIGKPGKAFSILEGARLAKADILAMIDGDLQYPPEALPEMYAVAKEKGVAVANRSTADTTLPRKFVSRMNKFMFGKLLLGWNLDTQSGLKVFKKDIIDNLIEEDITQWTIDIPLLTTAIAMGYDAGSVDIHFSERSAGKSNVSLLKSSIEIGVAALKHRFGDKGVVHINNGGEMLGSGVYKKRRKYITHTNLHHKGSAVHTFSILQKATITFMAILLMAGLVVSTKNTAIILIAILSAIYFIDMLFSLFVLLKSLHFPPELSFSKRQVSALKDGELPMYTILSPLYREARVLPAFIESMKALDWPKDKLEVLLLLEEDDKETLEAAASMDMPGFVKTVVVPDSQPRTKPKACNYGLHFAKGEYIVIYDAEDKPDPLQLKKTYLGFQKLGEKVICLQCKLNYYNPKQNFLTRLFTAEYSLWFDVILPGLQSIDTTIPLGGTSNHFRTQELRKLKGWDPFNVTEDCDLGVRIFKEGYKTAIVDSTTLEEANSNVRNWIRQRSRWIKGYFQTYLVHTREPLKFVKTHGLQALVFQLVIGMRMSFILINPVLWLATIAYFTAYSVVGPTIESLYPTAVFYVAAFSLAAGNFLYFYNYMIGCAKRGHWSLIKYVFLIPFYWMLTSIAAMLAAYQLLVKPHYWEKTHHGLHLDKIKRREYLSGLNFGVNIGLPDLQLYSRLKKAGNIQATPGLLLILAAVFANFMNFLTSIYLGRVLTPTEFGLISLMTSFLFIAQLPSGGVSSTISHMTAYLYGKYGKIPGQIWKRYRTKFITISLVLGMIWGLLIPALMSFFNSHTALPFVFFIPMWSILLLGAVASGFLGGSLKFQLLALLVVIESVAKFVLSVIFIKAGLGNWVYATLPLSLFFSLLISLYFAGRLANKSSSTVRTNTQELVFPKKFFATSMLTGFSTISFLSLDLVFVKHYLPAEEAGNYALLILVGRMVYMVGALFSQFILPFVSRDSGAKVESNNFQWLLAGVLSSTIAMFIMVGPLGQITVPILFGQKAFTIIPYLTPFAFSMILFSVAYSIVIYYQAKKQYIFSLPGTLTVLVMTIGLYLFHQNILRVVEVMLASSAFFLSVTVLLHFNISKVNVFVSNCIDLLDLFIMKLNGKKPLPGGQLRILMLNWRDIKHAWAGGAEVYVHELAKRWVADGHSVTLFCGNDGKSKRNEVIDGVNIYRRGGFFTVYIWAILYNLLRFRRRFDVIVESENGIPFFTPLYSGKPKVLIVHHLHQEVFRAHLRFPLSGLARFVESRLTPLIYRNQKIVAVSESTKADLIQFKIADEANIEIVSPGININSYSKHPKTKYPSFVYLGRHKAYKNIDVAILAFVEVLKKYPKATLTIAGDGEITHNLKALAKKVDTNGSIVFRGRVNEDEKTKILGESWAALQPSSFEGWGITVLETNACGTPVIASNVKGLRDSVIDGKTGILVSVKDADQFAGAMFMIIEDRNFRDALSRECFKWAQNFDWNKQADVFTAVLTETVRNAVNTPYYSPAFSYEEEE